MKEEQYTFNYKVFESIAELNSDDQLLLRAAQDAASSSYAPYSQFNVGAAAMLVNGEVVSGGNVENASFPAGLCAEGVVLAVASSRFPGTAIKTLAITYKSVNRASDKPIAPCGICRQSLQEFRERTGAPVRLIMGGFSGYVFVVEDASLLMPLAFTF